MKSLRVLYRIQKALSITGAEPGIFTSASTLGNSLEEYYTEVNRQVAARYFPFESDTDDDVNDTIMEESEGNSLRSSKKFSNMTKLVKPVSNSSR